MKPDGIILRHAEARGKQPQGMLEVGASGRHEHYSCLGPGEEEGEEVTKQSKERMERAETEKCTNTDNSGTIEFVLVFGVIVLERKTTERIPTVSSRKH